MNFEKLSELGEDKPKLDGDLPELADEGIPGEEEIIEQPKRKLNGSALLLFGLLAAVGGGTYLMVLRAGTNGAGFSPQAASAATTINGFLKGGAQDLQHTINLVHDTEKVVAQFNSYPSAHQVPVSDLQANPFKSTEVKVEATAPLSEDAAKREADEARQNAANIAAGLKLESIVSGNHPCAMINGKTYAIGQGNQTFTVEKIVPQGVWVRIGSVPFEIKMTPPRMD